MKTPTTRTRTDYTQLAAQLNYAALSEKLDRLRELPPPKKRKRIGDLLAPLEIQLRELHAKGWTYEQLSNELSNFGLPVKSAAVRDYLTEQKSKRSIRARRRINVIVNK